MQINNAIISLNACKNLAQIEYFYRVYTQRWLTGAQPVFTFEAELFFTWFWHLQPSCFVEVNHLFSFHCDTKRVTLTFFKENEMYCTWIAVNTLDSIYAVLTFLQKGNHFVNNILQLSIRSARKKMISTATDLITDMSDSSFPILISCIPKTQLQNSLVDFMCRKVYAISFLLKIL